MEMNERPIKHTQKSRLFPSKRVDCSKQYRNDFACDAAAYYFHQNVVSEPDRFASVRKSDDHTDNFVRHRNLQQQQSH